MKIFKTYLPSVLLAACFSTGAYAQYVAPSSIAPSLIEYSASTNPSISSSRVILYNSDQTYVEINSLTNSGPNNGTQPTHSGTYVYAVDPSNAAHATIVYDGGIGTITTDNLYFTSASAGQETPPGGAFAGGGPPIFTWAPKVETNGGVNISNRCQVGSGAVAISGFVVGPASPRWVLLRAVGPSLSIFGVTGVASSPSVALYDSTQAVIGTSSVWSADPNLTGGFSTVFSLAGAFPLTSGSNEGVLLMQLAPGAYTGVFSAGNAGTILCEVYFLPF